MIKPIDPTPLNTCNKLYFKCEGCGLEGTIVLENSIVNVDENGNGIDMESYECQKCGAGL